MTKSKNIFKEQGEELLAYIDGQYKTLYDGASLGHSYLEFEDIFIYCLPVRKGTSNRNVIALDIRGNEIWKIQGAPPHPGNQYSMPYSYIEAGYSKKSFLAINQGGTVYEIDTKNGGILKLVGEQRLQIGLN